MRSVVLSGVLSPSKTYWIPCNRIEIRPSPSDHGPLYLTFSSVDRASVLVSLSRWE